MMFGCGRKPSPTKTDLGICMGGCGKCEKCRARWNDPSAFMVFVSQFALTTGIIERKVLHAGDGFVVEADPKYYLQHYKPGDWHLTKEAAVAKAEEMRLAEINKLERRDFRNA